MFILPENVSFILNTLNSCGYDAYIVGGCVRDLLMGKTPADFDITTSALPQQIKECFEHTADTGIKHGTVSVIIGNDVYETTTFRTESGYSNRRSPDSVSFVSDVNGDLSRRDFTVNAMCYNEAGGLIDLFGGINDIKNNILRTVGNPYERFSEDALRILRLYRFASTLNFSIDKDTEKAAIQCAGGLKHISRERIFAELKKASYGDNLAPLKEFINTNALSFLGICNCKDLSFIKKLSKNTDIRFYALIRQCNASDGILENLKASNKLKSYFNALDNIKINISSDKAEIKYNLKNFDLIEIKDYIEYHTAFENSDYGIAEQNLNEILQNNEPYRISQLAINGEDLKKNGITGESIGTVLEMLLDTVIKEPTSNKKEILLKLI